MRFEPTYDVYTYRKPQPLTSIQVHTLLSALVFACGIIFEQHTHTQ